MLSQLISQHHETVSPEEFSRLALLHRQRLVRKAKYYSMSSEQAEDAVQQAFMKAWKGLGSFRGDSTFGTWITRILINEIFQLKRRDRRVVTFPLWLEDDTAHFSTEKLKCEALSPEDAYLRREEHAALKSSIGRLPPNFRQIVEMRVLQELSIEDVARSLKLTVPAVKSRMVRGRLELKRRLLLQNERLGKVHAGQQKGSLPGFARSYEESVTTLP